MVPVMKFLSAGTYSLLHLQFFSKKNLIDWLVKIIVNYIEVIFQKSRFDMYKPIVDFITGTWQVACQNTL